MLQVRGQQTFMARLRKDKAALNLKVTKTYHKLITAMFTDLVQHSPQWSGNLAQQWYIETTGKQGAYNPIPIYSSTGAYRTIYPYQMGDDPAVSSTLFRELPKVDGIHWRNKVTFVNHAPYASEVEQGIGPGGLAIRPENTLASYGGVAMVGYIDAKYSKMRYLKRLIV